MGRSLPSGAPLGVARTRWTEQRCQGSPEGALRQGHADRRHRPCRPTCWMEAIPQDHAVPDHSEAHRLEQGLPWGLGHDPYGAQRPEQVHPGHAHGRAVPAGAQGPVRFRLPAHGQGDRVQRRLRVRQLHQPLRRGARGERARGLRLLRAPSQLQEGGTGLRRARPGPGEEPGALRRHRGAVRPGPGASPVGPVGSRLGAPERPHRLQFPQGRPLGSPQRCRLRVPPPPWRRMVGARRRSRA
mmetsp:Transcript_80229/g.250095  ORF Transcript_80229/g.250095 Transcript_80229/m.250095 type:complete len:242 (+) Transcript_80229:348-1073(+)